MGWFSMFWPVQYISMKLQILSLNMFDTVLDATDYIIKCTHAFQGHFCRSCTSVISCLSFFIRINFWSQNIHVYLSGKERSWSRKVAIDYNKKYVTVRYGSLCEEALLIRSCFFARRVYQRRERIDFPRRLFLSQIQTISGAQVSPGCHFIWSHRELRSFQLGIETTFSKGEVRQCFFIGSKFLLAPNQDKFRHILRLVVPFGLCFVNFGPFGLIFDPLIKQIV